jgi:hypothetical protein
VLFREQSVAALVAALEHFASGRLWLQLPAEGQRLWAETFCPARFHQRMTRVMNKSIRSVSPEVTFVSSGNKQVARIFI